MATLKLSAPDIAQMRDEWLDTIEKTLREAENWAADFGWRVSRSQKTAREDLLGVYEVPSLTIETDETEQGKLVLEPVARMVFGAQGRLDLYAYPSLYRVMLLHSPYTDGPEWVVRTDSGIDWPQSWGKDAFYALAQGLLRRP